MDVLTVSFTCHANGLVKQRDRATGLMSPPILYVRGSFSFRDLEAIIDPHAEPSYNIFERTKLKLSELVFNICLSIIRIK